MNREIIIGEKFGRLTVIEKIPANGNPQSTYKCICDCGSIRINRKYSLLNGIVVSCGCYHKETIGNLRRSHCGTGTRLYSTWCNMKQRCKYSEKRKRNNYALNGITVCDEWKNSFFSFREWAINNGYNDKLTIDRVDNTGNYTPENCRWITNKLQQYNKSTNKRLVVNGISKTITEWATEMGVNCNLIYGRLKSGWSINDAVLCPKLLKIKKEEIK